MIEENTKNNQELIIQLGMFEQQARQLQQQIQSIEQGIDEISILKEGLADIKNGKEILASVGRGIFVKAKLSSDDLIVDVGSKNFVKKSIPETKKIIEEQIEKLLEVKTELQSNLEKLGEEIQKLVEEASKRN